MAFSIVTFTGSLQNLIHKNNTTTSSLDISSNLVNRVKSVTAGFHQGKSIPNTLYPCVFVEPKRKEDEFNELGTTARRNMKLNYDIIAITNYGLGLPNGRKEADDEMLQLSTNIEKLFRNYPRLSITSVMHAIVTSAEYDIVESNETYNSMAKIGLTVDIMSD